MLDKDDEFNKGVKCTICNRFLVLVYGLIDKLNLSSWTTTNKLQLLR